MLEQIRQQNDHAMCRDTEHHLHDTPVHKTHSTSPTLCLQHVVFTHTQNLSFNQLYNQLYHIYAAYISTDAFRQVWVFLRSPVKTWSKQCLIIMTWWRSCFKSAHATSKCSCLLSWIIPYYRYRPSQFLRIKCHGHCDVLKYSPKNW